MERGAALHQNDCMKKKLNKRRRRGRITATTRVGPDHAVVTVSGDGEGPFLFRREVCQECPWRKDRPTKVFPAEAFRHSARTCYDMAENAFACHMAGHERSQVCAGFLLSDSACHNMGLRIKSALGKFHPDDVRETAPTYRTYREMAEANGVDADDPVLARCR